MYSWYRKAKVYYVYLAGVPSAGPSFSSSRWFTRGWTLQELLASHDVRFFSSTWTLIGAKNEVIFALSDITGIEVWYLGDSKAVWQATVAERMSWVSKRLPRGLKIWHIVCLEYSISICLFCMAKGSEHSFDFKRRY